MHEATVQPEVYGPAEERCGEAAERLRLALIVLDEICLSNPDMICACIWKAAGLSYSTIGFRLGVSKQAVEKWVQRIGERNSALADFMGLEFHQQDCLAGECRVRQRAVSILEHLPRETSRQHRHADRDQQEFEF